MMFYGADVVIPRLVHWWRWHRQVSAAAKRMTEIAGLTRRQAHAIAWEAVRRYELTGQETHHVVDLLDPTVTHGERQQGPLTNTLGSAHLAADGDPCPTCRTPWPCPPSQTLGAILGLHVPNPTPAK